MRHEPRLPPMIYWIMAAGLFWATNKYWGYGQQGHGGSTIAAIIFGYLGVSLTIKGFRARTMQRWIRSAEEQSTTPSDTHGTARWGTVKDAKKAGMLKTGNLFLGRLQGRDLHFPGEAHLLTLAPPGAGKGTCIVVPNLLTYPGSMIVTDPKGELTAMTARHRRERMGHNVIVLNPWREKLSEEMGVDLGDHGFNPLSIIKPGPDVKDDAEMVAALLLPTKSKMSGSEEFFIDFGQSILTAFILYLISRGAANRVTLPELRRMIMAPAETLQGHLDNMATTDEFGGVIREYAGKLSGTLENAPEEFQGGLSSAQKALRIYDMHGPLGAHVSHGEIDLGRIKETPTTIYLIIPGERAGTHAPWMNLIMSLSMELVARNRSNRRVVFLMDEFANLGYMPGVLRAMALYRGMGVQVWAIIQQLRQLHRVYGQDEWHEIFGMAEMINTFGIWEPESIKLVSDWIGQETVKDFSQSLKPELVHSGQTDFSFGASNTAKPLLRAEDIRKMPGDRQLIFYKNLPPFFAKKVDYLKRRAWRKLAEPNPYHRNR